ncbi:MAG: PepSY domain-containing protein [Hyphomicrobiaceae bacterium]
MNRKTLLTALVAGTLATGAIGGLAYARERGESRTDEAAIMTNAKITMAQAIATAELATGGKAVGTGIEDQDGTVNFEVSVLKDGARQKVLIDTQTGKVVKTVTAQNDDDNDSD